MSERLTPEEIAFLDDHSGTTEMDDAEVDRIVAAGRAAAQEARYPDVPHLAEIITALPENQRDAFRVSSFVEHAMIDSPDGENPSTVREHLRAGRDLEPVLRLARQADQWGM